MPHTMGNCLRLDKRHPTVRTFLLKTDVMHPLAANDDSGDII